jgi:photoactive yellow protein
MSEIPFDAPDLGRQADGMTQSQLDRLSFGALLLDADGRVVAYNAVEEQIAGVDYRKYVSYNFFTQLAPCMDNPYFRGRFEQGIAEGNLDMDFHYDSDTDPRAQNVRVRMQNSARPGLYWVFIKRL